ncbi:heavy metal response regulator transcription factor [Acidiphilium sp.]|uniref:heavy metal response regulator transcription factor n=1 Tax=Acidiphilium sp. TaxID=527 RepID=UPI003CFF24F9
MKLLIIEDEIKTAGFLKKGLEENGFSIDIAEDGGIGASLARQGDYDLIILDVMLPGLDGWSVLQALRRRRDLTPVLFLTARDNVADRVHGLELGADDYIVKPFAFSELLARIRTILRRGPLRQAATLQVGDLEIDVQRHRASRAGCVLDLTPKEFLLLSLLARRAGDVITRTLIAEQVWDINFDSGANVVDVHMHRLRAKVDDPFAARLIHTVRGIGYVLEDRSRR